MDVDQVKVGLKVKTSSHLESTTGMLIPKLRLDLRKPDVLGEVAGYVAGHGGDVWWVKHVGTNDLAPYIFTELEPA